MLRDLASLHPFKKQPPEAEGKRNFLLKALRWCAHPALRSGQTKDSFAECGCDLLSFIEPKLLREQFRISKNRSRTFESVQIDRKRPTLLSDNQQRWLRHF